MAAALEASIMFEQSVDAHDYIQLSNEVDTKPIVLHRQDKGFCGRIQEVRDLAGLLRSCSNFSRNSVRFDSRQVR